MSDANKNNNHAIDIKSVGKRLGSKQVLQNLNLTVPKGQTFAFLGRNGAGKTTTIRMLLGLLQPDEGLIRVLGLDPSIEAQALEIRRRVGYLAEDPAMHGWMRISELLWFLEPFYPTWDGALARQYLDEFRLSPEQKVKNLSKGQTVRLGLLLALAHRPEMVVLDDPTLGLDPIARKQFLGDVVDHLQSAGATVFFSSHLLYEVEPVADAVAILEDGHIVEHATTEELRERVKRLIFLEDDYKKVRPLPGILDIRRSGQRVAVTVKDTAGMMNALHGKGVTAEVVDLNLDEIFEAIVIGQRMEGA